MQLECCKGETTHAPACAVRSQGSKTSQYGKRDPRTDEHRDNGTEIRTFGVRSSVVFTPDPHAQHRTHSPGISSLSSWAILRSFLSARASNCRMRSLVTPRRVPTCSRVCGSAPWLKP